MNSYCFNLNEVGVDEAGRGPLIGRVYAAAVCIGVPQQDTLGDIPLITDSKKMTRKQRQEAYNWIINNVKGYSVAYAEPSEIDNINILQATRLAMLRALQNLKEKIDFDKVIIDGPRWENKFDELKECQIKSVIKGDSKYLAIAAASILAKEEHDKHIREICILNTELNERYDLLNNMGYGTKKHLEGIKKYGISDYHRKSFKCCK